MLLVVLTVFASLVSISTQIPPYFGGVLELPVPVNLLSRVLIEDPTTWEKVYVLQTIATDAQLISCARIGRTESLYTVILAIPQSQTKELSRIIDWRSTALLFVDPEAYRAAHRSLLML